MHRDDDPALVEDTDIHAIPRRPFGEPDCESEIRLMHEEYRKYYFYHTGFSEQAMRPEVYLIIGRRGAGKTALSHFFSFQSTLPNAQCIDVNEPKLYQTVLERLSSTVAFTRETAIPRLADIWEFVLWSLIFNALRGEDKRIGDANIFGIEATQASTFVKKLIESVLKSFGRADEQLGDEFEAFIANDTVKEGKEAVLAITRTRPLIIAFDTLENYAVHDESMLRAMTALVECAQRFNSEFAGKGIHLKVFVMAEVYPYLCEQAGLNVLKYVKDEVMLHWRPRDLMRLLCWRFYRYLRHTGAALPLGKVHDWADHREVMAKMWTPFFGESLRNGRGLVERTFPYVLRHTQLRPRQLIVLANDVAKASERDGTFPRFSEDAIRSGIKVAEQKLAMEVISGFSSVYPNVGTILDSLSGMNALFKGNELDKRASVSRSMWPSGEYSLPKFRQLVAELGIVGRVRAMDGQQVNCEVDYEYSRSDRLPLLPSDMCAIHPMFYGKLLTKIEKPLRVFPFPDHPDFAELEHL